MIVNNVFKIQFSLIQKKQMKYNISLIDEVKFKK